jgi:hypothetical protein
LYRNEIADVKSKGDSLLEMCGCENKKKSGLFIEKET